MPTAPSNSKQNQVAIADYVEDMYAVESHIAEALDRQLSMFADQPEIRAEIVGFHAMANAQRDALAQLKKDLPKEPVGNTVKDVGSAVLGKAAGLIDKIRRESDAKALRDDYTAFNLAAVSYGMLHTTALALDEPNVAKLADTHLRGYAGAAQKINRLLPAVVVHDLEQDGLQTNAKAIKAAQSAIKKAWKETAK
jgi:ferritin-like metal-binding protein YciE